MKFDHFVINIDSKYQEDKKEIERINNQGIPYQPKKGKHTGGFQASNFWIGNEYLEMISILKKDGGGWKQDWTKAYLEGHRGLQCLMLDVEDIQGIYQTLLERGVMIEKPERLTIRWFFHLFTRKMPWQNCYLPLFEGVPFQIGFQQIDSEKVRATYRKYMIPNTCENNINRILRTVIQGPFTNNDIEVLQKVFPDRTESEDSIMIELSGQEKLEFRKATVNHVDLFTDSDANSEVIVENVTLHI